MRFSHAFESGWNLARCTPFWRVSTLNIRTKKKENLFYISQSQEGNLVDCRELRLINLSTSERKSRELLLTLVPRTPISLEKNSYLPSVRRWHRPNSVSAREASASSGARSPLTPPVGKKEDGHSAGWLSGPLCPIPPTPTPHSHCFHTSHH